MEDLTIGRHTGSHVEKAFEGTAEQSIDTELSLPDYCADIQRILKCTAELCLRSAKQTGGRLTAEGDVVIRLIYVGDSGKIDCCESVMPLSCYTESNISDTELYVYADASVEYLNCRAVSQRRANVNGKIAVRFTLEKKQPDEFISSADGLGVQLKAELLQTQSVAGMTDKVFDMAETVALTENAPSVGGLIRCDAQAESISVKTIKGKLLLKGDLNCCVMYYSDDADRTVNVFRHTLPISQIIEISDIDENCVCAYNIKPVSVFIQPKPDSSGKNRLLDMVCRISTDIKCYEKKETTIVTDCYSIDHELKTGFSTIEVISDAYTRQEEKSHRCSIGLDEGISKAVEAWCPSISTALIQDNGRANGKGSALICIVFTDSQEKLSYVEKTVDFEFGFDIPNLIGKASCSANAHAKELAVSKVGDKLEIRLNAAINAEIRDIVTKRVCVSLEEGEKSETCRKNSALTLYFCREGEKLWNIAKHYGTTIDAIMSENALDGDTTTENTMLLIPACG